MRLTLKRINLKIDSLAGLEGGGVSIAADADLDGDVQPVTLVVDPAGWQRIASNVAWFAKTRPVRPTARDPVLRVSGQVSVGAEPDDHGIGAAFNSNAKPCASAVYDPTTDTVTLTTETSAPRSAHEGPMGDGEPPEPGIAPDEVASVSSPPCMHPLNRRIATLSCITNAWCTACGALDHNGAWITPGAGRESPTPTATEWAGIAGSNAGEIEILQSAMKHIAKGVEDPRTYAAHELFESVKRRAADCASGGNDGSVSTSAAAGSRSEVGSDVASASRGPVDESMSDGALRGDADRRGLSSDDSPNFVPSTVEALKERGYERVNVGGGHSSRTEICPDCTCRIDQCDVRFQVCAGRIERIRAEERERMMNVVRDHARFFQEPGRVTPEESKVILGACLGIVAEMQGMAKDQPKEGK